MKTRTKLTRRQKFAMLIAVLGMALPTLACEGEKQIEGAINQVIQEGKAQYREACGPSLDMACDGK